MIRRYTYRDRVKENTQTNLSLLELAYYAEKAGLTTSEFDHLTDLAIGEWFNAGGVSILCTHRTPEK